MPRCTPNDRVRRPVKRALVSVYARSCDKNMAAAIQRVLRQMRRVFATTEILLCGAQIQRLRPGRSSPAAGLGERSTSGIPEDNIPPEAEKWGYIVRNCTNMSEASSSSTVRHLTKTISRLMAGAVCQRSGQAGRTASADDCRQRRSCSQALGSVSRSRVETQYEPAALCFVTARWVRLG